MDDPIYVNWYALSYRGNPEQSVLVVERFNGAGVPFDSDVMAGPRSTWEIAGDAEMKNRNAIALGSHISCLELRNQLSAHVASKSRKPSDRAIPWAVQRRFHEQDQTA